MDDIYIPDYTQATEIYFPLGVAEGDIMVAQRSQNDVLKNVIQQSRVDIRSMEVPEFMDEDDILDNIIPSYVQSSGEMDSYLQALKDEKYN